MRWVVPICLLMVVGCKVPLNDIDLQVAVADVVWFDEEDTIFVFWELEAEQGLSESTIIEIRYTTDEGLSDWANVETLPQIHPTVAGDCPFTSECGVASFREPLQPRDVLLRVRFHEDAELAGELNRTQLHVVGAGDPHSNRSALVYGVFDEENTAIQWRTRHTFPNLRNEQVQRLGLRRPFTVNDPRFATENRGDDDNPYAYATACPDTFAALNWTEAGTLERAVFAEETLPDAALSASIVCGRSTLEDANGPFEATAVARKNPEVRPAFPRLRSPIVDATPVRFLLQLCDRDISASHLAMQRQRLLIPDNVDATCIDDLSGADLTGFLVNLFIDAIDRTRPDGNDMVLAIALHHDTPEIGPAIEDALATVLPPERLRPTPRVAGAFLLDSFAYQMEEIEAGRSTIWCPSAIVPDEISEDTLASANSLECVVLPDLELSFGPLSASALPILPPRSSYLNFIDTYSEEQAGRMTRLTFRVPELPPTVDSVDLAPLGVATFFNDETVSAEPDDAFSYCENRREYEGFIFRSPTIDAPLPIALLPDWHNLLREADYDLGVAWEFPYLLRLEYELQVATGISAFSASLSLGFPIEAEQDYGSSLWGDDSYSLRRTLLQCTRHCDHPTFDSAGIYQVNADFRTTYATACYEPAQPTRPGEGFPRDP